jgi:hemolysin activation/secretion protein
MRNNIPLSSGTVSRIASAILFSLLAAVTLTWPVASSAAPTADELDQAAREANRLQQIEQQRTQQERAEALKRAAPGSALDPRAFRPDVPLSGRTGACREIATIVLKGSTLLTLAEQQSLTANKAGKCLNVSDIEALMADVTKAYIDKGYIGARVYIPQQDLSTGTLELLVVEGVVEKILIRDGDKGSVSLGNVFPGVTGGVLNLRDIEQGLDQINRLASNNAKMSVEPGEKEGGSLIVIENTPSSTLHYGLSYDNQGSASTGKEQAALSLSADNLLGLNDFLSLNHRFAVPSDPNRRDSVSDSINYTVPWGYQTFTVGTSHSTYTSMLTTANGTELKSNGESDNSYLKLDRVMLRDQIRRVSGSASLTTKQTKNYLAGQFLSVSSRALTVLDLGVTMSTQVLGGGLGLDAGYSQGLDALGALTDASGLADGSPRAQFGAWKFGAMFNRGFALGGIDLAWSSQLSTQVAMNTLYGSEQFSVGGISSVRGFVTNSLAGDNGALWRNELSSRVPLALFGQTGMVKPYIALDVGEVSQKASGGAAGGQLVGAALGFTVMVGKATWDLFTGFPLSKPSSMASESPSTFFRLSLAL